MKVIRGSVNDIFQNAYNKFSNKCCNTKISIPEIKNNYITVRDLFIKSGQVQQFCDQTLLLSKNLEQDGKIKLSTLLINELSKLSMAFNLRQAPDEILKEAIQKFKANNDSLHELARIVDLELVYQYSGNRRNLFKVLHQKKNCCKRILANYEESVQNFVSIHRQPTSINDIKAQLAYTYSDLAEMLLRKKPEDAIALYEKSINIQQELGNTRAVNYAVKQIEYIKRYNRMFNK